MLGHALPLRCPVEFPAFLLAGFRSTAADFRAMLHFCIFLDGFARTGAGLAYIGTGGAHSAMPFRVTLEEIRSNLAKLDTVEHDLHMFRVRMVAAFDKAVVNQCIQAGGPGFP